jgi:hypothetical protein
MTILKAAFQGGYINNVEKQVHTQGDFCYMFYSWGTSHLKDRIHDNIFHV